MKTLSIFFIFLRLKLEEFFDLIFEDFVYDFKRSLHPQLSVFLDDHTVSWAHMIWRYGFFFTLGTFIILPFLMSITWSIVALVLLFSLSGGFFLWVLLLWLRVIKDLLVRVREFLLDSWEDAAQEYEENADTHQ